MPSMRDPLAPPHPGMTTFRGDTRQVEIIVPARKRADPTPSGKQFIFCARCERKVDACERCSCLKTPPTSKPRAAGLPWQRCPQCGTQSLRSDGRPVQRCPSCRAEMQSFPRVKAMQSWPEDQPVRGRR